MAIYQNTVERHLNTIWAIASSRYVKWFLVGFTAQSGIERMRGTYYANNFDHLVILADKLTQMNALLLEKNLQDACKEGSARGRPYRRKYHPDHRTDVYRRNIGTPAADPLDRVHSVYMAWIEP